MNVDENSNLIRMKALLLGERIDTRRVPVEERLSATPLCFRVGESGRAVVFRYGALVLSSVSAREEEQTLALVRRYTTSPLATPEVEEAKLMVRDQGREGVDGDTLYIQDSSVPRWLVVAEVLARSTLLAFYEKSIGDTFVAVQPVADRMQRGVFSRRHTSDLLEHIGDALVSQQRMIGSAQVADRPDVLWENPDLEALYVHLEDEYEIHERHQALRDKLDLVFRTAQTSLDLLQDRRSLRVEWYIVILIVVEILISLYELFVRPGSHGG